MKTEEFKELPKEQRDALMKKFLSEMTALNIAVTNPCQFEEWLRILNN